MRAACICYLLDTESILICTVGKQTLQPAFDSRSLTRSEWERSDQKNVKLCVGSHQRFQTRNTQYLSHSWLRNLIYAKSG